MEKKKRCQGTSYHQISFSSSGCKDDSVPVTMLQKLILSLVIHLTVHFRLTLNRLILNLRFPFHGWCSTAPFRHNHSLGIEQAESSNFQHGKVTSKRRLSQISSLQRFRRIRLFSRLRHTTSLTDISFCTANCLSGRYQSFRAGAPVGFGTDETQGDNNNLAVLFHNMSLEEIKRTVNFF